MELKVGGHLYFNHINNRYKREGLPPYWEQLEIIGETEKSWICHQAKFNKKTLNQIDLRGYSGGYAVATLEEVNQKEWCRNHGHRIGNAIGGADYDKLKQIAKIIGYKGE